MAFSASTRRSRVRVALGLACAALASNTGCIVASVHGGSDTDGGDLQSIVERDGGSPADAGRVDAGAVDAGSSDAGPEADAGPGDAGVVLGPPFLAVGYGALRAFSTDGKSWVRAPDPAQLPSGWSGPPTHGDDAFLLRGGCYGEGLYLAVGGTGGDQGLMLSSQDEQPWTLVGGAQANDDCAYAGGIWVTQRRWSTDGAHWQLATTATEAREIAFGNGVFVAVHDHEGSVAYTRDGKDWIQLPITFTGAGGGEKGYNRVVFGGGRFMAINTSTPDAPLFTWDGNPDHPFREEPHPAALEFPLYNLAYGRHAFYVSSFNKLYRLADGAQDWEVLQGSGARELYNLVVTDALFVNENVWSTDGRTWNASGGDRLDAVTKIIATPHP